MMVRYGISSFRSPTGFSQPEPRRLRHGPEVAGHGPGEATLVLRVVEHRLVRVENHGPRTGTRFDHDVAVEAGRVRSRKKGPSKPYRNRYGHTPLSPHESIPWASPRLVVGTGASGRLPIMPDVWEEAAGDDVSSYCVSTSNSSASSTSTPARAAS